MDASDLHRVLPSFIAVQPASGRFHRTRCLNIYADTIRRIIDGWWTGVRIGKPFEFVAVSAPSLVGVRPVGVYLCPPSPCVVRLWRTCVWVRWRGRCTFC